MSGKNFSIENRVNLFFLITILILFLTGLLAIQNKNEFMENAEWVKQSFYVEKQLNEIHAIVLQLDMAERNYMSGNSYRAGKTIDSLNIILLSQTDPLKIFIAHNEINKKNIDTLQQYIYAKVVLQKNLKTQKSNQISSNYKNISANKEGIILSDKITNLINEMNGKEERIFYKRSEELKSLKDKSYLIIVILVIFIILFMTTLMIRIRNELKLRRMAENELFAKSEELNQLNKSRNMLYSIIAHDLRSPFQPILTLAEILHSDYEILKPEQIKDYAGKLNSVGRGVLALLDNLLEWTKVQTGSMNFNPESFLLRERAECAFYNLRLSAEVKKIMLINEIDKTLTVYADMNMVLSIIQNIVSNAIKFTPLEGTIKIMSKKENNHVLVSVEDDGIGMTLAQQKMIFKKGSHHSTPGTNRESGSGLGLLLCKELVEIHGGKIWSESQEGKGSTFYFTIPDKISN